MGVQASLYTVAYEKRTAAAHEKRGAAVLFSLHVITIEWQKRHVFLYRKHSYGVGQRSDECDFFYDFDCRIQ